MRPSSLVGPRPPLAGFRFRFDDPAHYGIEVAEGGRSDSLRLRALSEHVRVSELVLLRIARATAAAAAALEIERPIGTFVYPSATANAYCWRDSRSEEILFFIASALVALLDDAELICIAGHELGHSVFGHEVYPDPSELPLDLRRLELWRAAEISADRAGLIACADIETAVRAMLKAASGLGTQDLEVDVSEYIRQVHQLRESNGDETVLFSTHPPFPVRVRALLRFDSVRERTRSGMDAVAELAETDHAIDREMLTVAGGTDRSPFTELARRAAFWHLAAELCRPGVLGKAEQEALARSFSRERVEALRRILEDSTRDEARRLLTEKALALRAELMRAPLFAERSFARLLDAFRV